MTSRAAAIDIDGRHRHTFANPSGIVFQIGCFSAAPGCMAFPTASTDFAWFAGHSWRVEVCVRCHEHLGWLFEGDRGSFHGLVLDRLRESDRARAG